MNGTLAVFHAFMGAFWRGVSRKAIRRSHVWQRFAAWALDKADHHHIARVLANIRRGRRE